MGTFVRLIGVLGKLVAKLWSVMRATSSVPAGIGDAARMVTPSCPGVELFVVTVQPGALAPQATTGPVNKLKSYEMLKVMVTSLPCAVNLIGMVTGCPGVV